MVSSPTEQPADSTTERQERIRRLLQEMILTMGLVELSSDDRRFLTWLAEQGPEVVGRAGRLFGKLARLTATEGPDLPDLAALLGNGILPTSRAALDSALAVQQLVGVSGYLVAKIPERPGQPVDWTLITGRQVELRITN